MEATMSNALRAIGAALLLCVAPLSTAQDYPNKPIRLVVPQPAGGPTDIVARLVAQKLSERLGQQIVVDNRPGAGSNIGTDIVAKAPKDGYTLVVATVQHIVNPFLFSSLPFDAVKDFAPVTLMTKAYIVLDVNPEVPVHSVKELVAYAKAKPGGVSWASAGNGSTSHLALELFKVETGVPATHVPYKGTPPALNDLMGGRVQVMFDGVITSLPQIKAGKLRPLAVASSTRSPLLPDVPTMTEAGVPGFEAVGLAAILAPAGTPQPIVDKLYREIAAILKMPDVKSQLEGMGLEIVASSPSEFSAYIDSESKKWGKLIKDAKVTVD
jgi:tripartite-type tricarboxylate transporter receptor subunit TctC